MTAPVSTATKPQPMPKIAPPASVNAAPGKNATAHTAYTNEKIAGPHVPRPAIQVFKASSSDSSGSARTSSTIAAAISSRLSSLIRDALRASRVDEFRSLTLRLS